ncbi:MAG: transposase [Candidatus Melainabacteria bacterium]|jgi:hypothetical protein
MGIGLVNAVSVDEEGRFHLKDYRIYSKKEDGKTKIQLAHEMVQKSKSEIVLFDSWYASKYFMKFLNEGGKIFYSTLPSSRVFYDEQNKKYKLKDYEFTEEEKKEGKLVQLNKMNFKVRIFHSCVKKGEVETIVTNDINQSSLEESEKMLSLRWGIEEFHREIKNVTGIEKCQARKSRIQRNHICCCLMAWQFLKAEARKRELTIYALHQSQSDNFIRSQLFKPKLKFA